ncbi:MAG: hypothetical protein ACRECH_10850 [Nitrososphaerales archaeon]
MVRFDMFGGVTPFYFSLTIFDGSMTLLAYMLPRKFGVIPIFQLLLGSVLFGFSRLIVVMLNFIFATVVLIVLNSHSTLRPEKSIRWNVHLFALGYLVVGLSLLPTAVVTFSTQNSNLSGWLIVVVSAIVGWFYTKLVRFGVAGGVVYWLSTIVFLILVPDSSSIAQIALAANLTGIYFALLKLSPLSLKREGIKK